MAQVSEEDTASFREDGVVCLRGVVNAEWLAFLSEACAQLRREPGPMAETLRGGLCTVACANASLAQRLNQ